MESRRRSAGEFVPCGFCGHLSGGTQIISSWFQHYNPKLQRFVRSTAVLSTLPFWASSPFIQMYVNATTISTQTFLTKIIIDLSLAVKPYKPMWGMQNCQWSHMGCPSQVDRTWPFLCCPVCLTPPPRARRIGPGIPGPPPTTRACDSGEA